MRLSVIPVLAAAAALATAGELEHEILVAVQEQQRGTGDAVQAGLSALPADFAGTVIVAARR